MAKPVDKVKRWKTFQARAALCGMAATLIEADDGASQIICSRWALTRSFASFTEAETWLASIERRIG